MPVSGRFRYNVGDPFYIYDLRVDLMNKGQFKELVLIDEN